MIDTLYVSDLDGTLLQADAVLSPESHAILRELLEQGLPLTVATARTAYSVLPILDGLPFRIPWILQNGAVLYDPAAKRILHAAVIEPNAFLRAIRLFRRHGLNGFVYCVSDGVLQCCYDELSTEDMRQFYQERKDRYEKPFRQIESLEQLAFADAVFCSLHATRDRMQPIADALQSNPDLSIAYYQDVYRTDIWYLELAAADATKWHGVERLRSLLQPRTITGFGDNHNDLPLFQACDRRIAVSNAADALKAAADLVIGTNLENAVARYLQSTCGDRIFK